ncbi:MAG TPA: cytochrome c oxidase subunit II [Candidatus Limnocylindrales bacterium]
MSSYRRTRPSTGAIVVGAVLLVLLALIAFAAVRGTNLGKAANDIMGSMFPPAAVTEQGRQIRGLYDVVFLIAAVIFLLVEGLIIWSVVRYRRKPGDNVLPAQTHGNNVAEITWTLIPTIIVAFLFYISWQTLNSVDAVSTKPDIHVRAVAGQFQWSFVYLGDDGQTEQYTQFVPIGNDGGLVLPVGRNVQLSLESPDVIHAFYVPQFLFKRDVVPGQVNKFDFTIDQNDAGQTFRGQCAELCGIGHRAMVFEVHAMSQQDYDAWLKQKIESAKPTARPSGSGVPPAASLNLVAQGIQFKSQTLEAPANKPFEIKFDNQDAGITHDVAIQDPKGTLVVNGDDVKGPGQATYSIQPLQPGDYKFICTFHSNMTGVLTVK